MIVGSHAHHPPLRPLTPTLSRRERESKETKRRGVSTGESSTQAHDYMHRSACLWGIPLLFAEKTLHFGGVELRSPAWGKCLSPLSC